MCDSACSSLTFPEYNADRASDIKTEEILHFMCNLEPEELADDAVPRRTELPVHIVFDDAAAFLEVRAILFDRCTYTDAHTHTHVHKANHDCA